MSKINNQVYRLGVMGGTFDPVHFGHLLAAERAREEFCLDEVLFVPAGRPPHKHSKAGADPWMRYRMTELAISTNENFFLSDMEIERDGPSYTVDTVKTLLELYRGVQIFFITGADAFLEINTWKSTAELLTLCSFVAVSRPGYNMDRIWKIMKAFVEHPEWHVFSLGIPSPDISSTEIRKRVREGRTIKYMLPESVIDFIAEHGLYRSYPPEEPQPG